jgi:phosphate/sulfate permease
MKERITITLSVAGLWALFASYFGLHTALVHHYHAVIMALFYAGFAPAFLAAVSAAKSWLGHWLSRRIVSLSVIPCFAVLVAVAAAGCSRATNDQLATKVALTKPYPLDFEGAESDRISVQYAVIELAKQAKLGYDWDASRANAGEVCGKYITPEIEGIPLREALAKILKPEALTYDIQGGKIVLKKN